MSDTCGNCSCADKSQCVKKGTNYGYDNIGVDGSHVETFVMDVAGAENDGKCKCGASCTCVNCTCGH